MQCCQMFYRCMNNPWIDQTQFCLLTYTLKIFSYILKWGTWVCLRYMDGCARFVYWLKFWAKKGSCFSRCDTRSNRWVFFKVMQRCMLNRQTGAMQNSVLWPQYKPGYFVVSIWTVWAGESLCASFGSVSELIQEDCSAALLLTEGRSKVSEISLQLKGFISAWAVAT